MIACNETDLFIGDWWQTDVLLMFFVGVAEVNALAQGTLRRVTRCLLIEHQTFQLRGGHSTTTD